jgi:hypothetical protein
MRILRLALPLLTLAACATDRIAGPATAPPRADAEQVPIDLASLPVSTADAAVLYIVDGVIYGEEMFRALRIAPERIATLEVVRDASCPRVNGQPVIPVLITLRNP